MSIRNDDATKKSRVRGINKRSSHVARKKRTTGKHLAIKGKLEGTKKKGRSNAKTFPHGRCALVHSKIPSNTSVDYGSVLVVPAAVEVFPF